MIDEKTTLFEKIIEVFIDIEFSGGLEKERTYTPVELADTLEDFARFYQRRKREEKQI